MHHHHHYQLRRFLFRFAEHTAPLGVKSIHLNAREQETDCVAAQQQTENEKWKIITQSQAKRWKISSSTTRRAADTHKCVGTHNSYGCMHCFFCA